MEVGQLGRGLVILISFTSKVVNLVKNRGLIRNFSGNVLYRVSSDDQGDMIIKCFNSAAQYRQEKGIYDLFHSGFSEVNHYIRAGVFDHKPCIFMTRLNHIDFVIEDWSSLVKEIVLSISKFHNQTLPDNDTLELRHIGVSDIVSNIAGKVDVKLKADHEYDCVFIHGDLYVNNVLRGPEGKIYFIDWERACFSVREKDYATLTVSLLLHVGFQHVGEILDQFRSYDIDYTLYMAIVLSEAQELKSFLPEESGKLDFIYAYAENYFRGAHGQLPLLSPEFM